MKRVISVCGSDGSDEHLSNYALDTAEKVGRLIALKGGVVACGGRGGIMRAACKCQGGKWCNCWHIARIKRGSE